MALIGFLLSNWRTVLTGGLGFVAGLALASVTIGPAQHHAGYVEGKAAMVAAVTKQNAVAGEAARRAKSNVDACDDAGGNWSQETGQCDR